MRDEQPVEPHAFVSAQPALVAPALDDDAVHVWWLHRQRTQGRAPLLALLAAYLATEPESLGLEFGAHGRPSLAPPHRLDFNWSHSGEHALVAVARGLPQLGVDIERRRPHPRAMALARRFFSAEELAMLQRLPAAHREAAFARLWTAKEAVLKGHGRGLGYGLQHVAFDLDPTRVRPLRFHGDVGAPHEWQVTGLQPGSELDACVAWLGPPRRLQRFSLQPDIAAAAAS